jgi:hypothetical protein
MTVAERTTACPHCWKTDAPVDADGLIDRHFWLDRDGQRSSNEALCLMSLPAAGNRCRHPQPSAHCRGGGDRG